nr:hypothetical protein [Tanacetum cinerariifolium]
MSQLSVDRVALYEYMAVWFHDQAKDLEQLGILNPFVSRLYGVVRKREEDVAVMAGYVVWVVWVDLCSLTGTLFKALSMPCPWYSAGSWCVVRAASGSGEVWCPSVWSPGSGHGIEMELEDMSGAFKFSERWWECERVFVCEFRYHLIDILLACLLGR